MLKMFREGSFNDVCIKLHDGEIKANKSVLAARCEYFAATFRWKDNNNHEVEKIVVNDCSKKIMDRIIEYIFTGIMNAKDLNLLEFLELKDQVRKMFPGDKLEEHIEEILQIKEESRFRYCRLPTILTILPTDEEIVKAVSLVEAGNLQAAVMVELARTIESSIWHEKGGDKFEERTKALVILISYGVIESVQHLKLDLREPRGNHLQELIPCVTGTIDISPGVQDYNLTTVLDAVNCKELYLFTKELNHEETEALVRAITSHVEILHMTLHYMFQMDYDTFRKYKGDGKCREVHIFYTPDSHLSSLLDSVHCEELHLFMGTNDLEQYETKALVRAMKSRVEILHLGAGGSQNGVQRGTVTLDFETLKMYKGDGKCREVHCNDVCIGVIEFDGPYNYRDFAEEYHKDLITCDGYIRGRKDKWLDDESAETWADLMNWDLQVKIQNSQYLFSRKKV